MKKKSRIMVERKILIVDDEALIRDMLEMAFTRYGYSVRSAEDAENALEILRGEKIQVIFSDLDMPGMNGLELCRKIREEFPFSIIYAISGHDSFFDISDCKQAGFDDYFKKPFILKDLRQVAEEAFEKIDMWNITDEE